MLVPAQRKSGDFWQTTFPHQDGQEIVIVHCEPLLTLLGPELLEAIKKWQDEDQP